MAFNINAQIILEQPKNLNNVAKNISKQLGKVTKIDLKIGNVQQLTNLNKQLTSLNSSLTKLNSNLSSTKGSVGALGSTFNKTATGVNNVGKAQGNLNTQVTRANQALKNQAGLVGTLGKRFGSVAKQAIAFGAISRPIYDLQRALTGAVKDAVAFEREIVRISQVTGKSVSQLNGLTTQITALSKELGISANELAETSRVIAQAGIRGRDLEQVLNALARSTLAPTFGKITDTTEGLIAAFGQFGLKGKDAEAVLGSLNKVSKEFAVEAEDLISVIRRTGGVFAQAAGDTKGTVGALQELTAVFTAVRSTTRESADTIAAGLRTIFSRIQRRSTINFLQQFGVDLTDAQGKFIGIFPAFDQLSKRLDTLIKQGDALTLSAIAEELGGIRQIGKLLPAIAQFDKARKALTEAQKGAVEGLGGDVAKALDTIDNRVKRIRESFNALIRQVFESDAFQGFAKSILNGSQAIIDAASSIFSALEPILPLLTALGTVKLGRAIGGLAGGALGGGLAGAASTVTGSATAQNTQKTAAAVVNQNTLISTTNSTLANMSRQLANLIQINNSGFNTLTSQAARGKSTVVTGFGGGRRRAAGGAIPKFADGGRVYGPSHAAGGVIAELEGGEYVIPKKYAQGTPRGGVSKGRRGNRAYVFDFDDTLGVSGSSGKELFSNDPALAASRQDKLRNARATSLANSARKRSQQGFDVHVLTARFGTPGDQAALQDFLVKGGIKPGRTIFTGGLFKGEREPGKKPGTTRQLSTASKKARILAELSKEYDSILFLDDAIENVLKAKDVKGVRPIAVNKQTQALKRAATGGLIPGYAKGDIVANDPVGILFQDSNLSESDPADKSATISKKQLSRTAQSQLKGINTLTLSNIKVSKFSREANFEKQRDIVTNAISTAVAGLNKSIGQIRGANGRKASPIPKDKITKTADLTLGRVFEDYVTGLAGLSSPGTKNFDLIGSEVTAVNRSGLAAGPVPNPTDIKLNLGKSSLESVVKKAYNEGIFANEIAAQQGAKRKASGRGRRRGAAAGGFIQKLATGDIVRANSVGVAILDPDDVADGKAAVSVADVESQLGFNKGTKKGFSGVGKVFKGKNYSIVKQGLNQKTSERFNKVLAEGLIKGVDFAASELSGDLGLGPTTIDQASKTKFIQSQRSALRGDLFEAALSSLSNRGRFDSAVDFARPFDFPNGLKGPFADNFSRLPSKFVDAKSSKEAAPDANIRGKILREIAADVVAQDPTIGQRLAQQGGGKKSKSKATGRGFGSLTFASGGEVPVRISNGEMVVTDPKEVAANRGKLQSINKLATGGFASGTIARGPGTGTSDSIYTTLPAGAFVVNAASTKKYLGLRRGGLAGAGRASGAAFASGGETAGAGIGLIFALQSLTAGLGEGSESLSFFINSVATAAFAVQGLGLKFGGIGKTLENALGKIPGVKGRAGDRISKLRAFGARGIGARVAGFGGVGGTAAAGVGAAAGGAVIGKIIGDIAGKAIADSFFGEQEEIAGFKGSTSAEQARSRGALEGGISGLGAGAGAGAGIGFVLGGPVGAAIGAAIGGGAGFLIGQAVGQQNAALEQAAFEAAKALQKSGENVSKSLDELEKEFTISGFGDLTKSLGEQQVNFNDAVSKFSNKFNDEITLTSLSLDFTRAIPGIDAAFAGLDSLFGTTLSAANEARNNASKAFIEASKLINQDDIKRAKVQLNASLDKFLDSFEVEDLAAVSGVDLVDSLREAANAGDTFAKNILKAADSIASAELAQTTSLLLQGGGTQKAQGQLLTDVQALRQQRPDLGFREAGEQVVNFERAQELFPREFLESQDQYRVRLSNIVNGTIQLLDAQDRQIEKTAEEAKQRAIVNKALKETTEELENIIQSLKSPFTDLAFQVETASSSFDVFKANIDRVFAGQGGFQTRGLQAGAFESDSAEALAERERVFSALDNITPGGAAGSRAAQRLRDEGPEIIKQVLEDARDTAASDDERLTPDVLLTRLETAFGNAGFQLPQGVSDVLSGISRQEDGSAIPEKILEDLINSDQLTKKFGEVFDAAAEGPAKFAEQLNKVIQLSEKRIAVETELLKKQRDLAKAITESRIATEKRTEQILSGTSLGAPTGTEIPDAIDRLTRRVVTIAGTSDTGELLSRRGAALGRQAELQQQIEENPALALNEDIEKERVALANEINQTTEALNLLATETEVFSKIIEKANRIGQNIGALESGLEDVIDKVASGDVAGVQQLAIDQATIGAAINGVATIPQALNALKALGQDQNKALVDVVTGIEGSGDALRRTLLSQLGTSLIAGGGLGGEVAGRYLLGILQQEQKAFALDQLQKERAAKQEKLQADIAAQNFEQTRLLRDLNQALSGDAFANAVTKFNDAVNKFVNVQPSEDGVVTRANGGSIFKPRGTDTVPAMLTPGEFVVRKSAVDQYGTGMMEAINSGNAQVFAASGGKVGKGVIYRQFGGGAAVQAAIRQRDAAAESKRESQSIKEKQQEFIALSDRAARNQINVGTSTFGEAGLALREQFPNQQQAIANVDFNSASSLQAGIDAYRFLINNKNEQRASAAQAARASILPPPNRVSAEGITFRGGRPSLADTEFGLTEEERQRFVDEELALYEDKPFERIATGADFLATKLRTNLLVNPLTDSGVESTGNPIIDEALGNQTLFQSQVENVRLRERQAELQKQNRLAERFFGPSGLAGANLNNLAEISGRGPDEVRFTGIPRKTPAKPSERRRGSKKNKFLATGRKVQEALVSQVKDEIAVQRAIDDFKVRNTPSLLAATSATPSLTGSELKTGEREQFGFKGGAFEVNINTIDSLPFPVSSAERELVGRGQTFNISTTEFERRRRLVATQDIADISRKNKEREELLTFQGSITAGLNRAAAAAGLEQIENPNQVFVDAELARRENEAAKKRVADLKAGIESKKATGAQLEQQEAAQTAATDTSSAVNAAAQKQETAAQKARRLRDQEIEARRNANRAARQQADEDARIRREQTGGLNQTDERAFRDGERAREREKNRKKSDEARKAAAQAAAKAREIRDLERANRLEELNNISDPLERSARRRELDQERRARNRSRARGSEAAASGFAAGPTSAASPGIAGLSSLTDNTVGSRGAEAQKRREDRAVSQFRAQFNRAVLSRNFNAARAIAQRYLTSGDISPETATIIKSQIDAAAPRFAGPGVQLYNQGGKVRGFSSGGDVPIMAQDGEFVMNRNAVQRLGVGTLTRMNNGLPTFHNGGPVYKQFGGRISGRRSGSNGPQTSVVINGSDAAKELNNAIITGGETVKQSWQTLFDTVAEGLNSALGQISTIPNQINATIAPVQIEGVGSFTEALAAQIVPKIVEQIAPLIGDNTNGGTTEQGAGV